MNNTVIIWMHVVYYYHLVSVLYCARIHTSTHYDKGSNIM